MTKEELRMCFALSFDELDENLRDCGLETQKNDYDETEKQLLKQYRELIITNEELRKRYQQALLSRSEKPHREVLEEFLVENVRQNALENADEEEDAFSEDIGATTKKPGRKKKKPLAIFDLLKEGQKKTGKPITLSRGIELLGACGLPEKSEYSPEEVEKFLETCDRIINQGHSLAQVATDNGVETTGSLWERTNTLGVQRSQQVVETMSDTFAVVDEQVRQVMEQSYLVNLEESLSNGNFDEAYERARQRIRAQNGPSPFEQVTAQFQLRQAQDRQHRQKLIQQTPEPPQLPPE